MKRHEFQIDTMIVAAIILVVALLLTGCTTAQAVPKAGFRVNPRTGWVEIVSPKDSQLQNAVFTQMKTNGVTFIQLQIGNYQTSMNPEVVKESAAGTAQMINAAGQLGAQMFALGLQAAAQASGVPAKPKPAP